MQNIFDYILIPIGVFILTLVFTILFSKWMRSRPKEERDAFMESMKSIVKIDDIIWRFFLWPMIAAISVMLIYLYFTDQL